MNKQLGPDRKDWHCLNPYCNEDGYGSAPDKCPKCGSGKILGLKIKKKDPPNTENQLELKL